MNILSNESSIFMFLSLILLNILSSRLIESSLCKFWLKSCIYSSGLLKFSKIISGILTKWFSEPSILTEMPVFLNELIIDSLFILLYHTSLKLSIMSFSEGGWIFVFNS